MGNEGDEIVFETVELGKFFFDPLERIDFTKVGNDSYRASARNGRSG